MVLLYHNTMNVQNTNKTEITIEKKYGNDSETMDILFKKTDILAGKHSR